MLRIPKPSAIVNEHRRVFDIEDLLDRRLGNVQRQPKDVRVRFSQMDKTGGNKEIHEPVQLELANPIRIQLRAPRC